MNTWGTFFLPMFMLLFLGACKSQKSQSSMDDSTVFREVHAGSNCGISEARDVLVSNQAELEKLWKEIHSQISPIPEVPEVDFQVHMLAASFMGTKNTGGYSVKIEGVKIDDGKYVITRNFYGPGKFCFTTMAITQPYAIATVDRAIGKDCRFEGEMISKDCR